jgi:hypothetical protein
MHDSMVCGAILLDLNVGSDVAVIQGDSDEDDLETPYTRTI